MINISTEFTDYGYTFNRSLSSVIQLPHTKDEVLLGVNELVNGYNFNSSINKLQSNLMYLYSVSKIAQPNLPKLYEGFIGKAAYATQKTEVILKNLTPYSLAVTAHANENLDEMPYFYVEDENNKTFTIAYDYFGINPSAENRRGNTIRIDLTKGEYGGDFLAVYATQQALSAYFQVNSYRWNDVYGGTNAWPVLELSTFTPGGLFFGGQSFNTFGSLLAQSPAAVKYQQGTTAELFKLWPNSDTRNIQYVSEHPVESKYFNYLTSLSVEEGTLSGYKSFFCISSRHISALSANTSSSLSADYTFVNITSSVGVNNELAFVGLNGSASSNSSLYVSDSATNGVYRINVNGFVKEDNIRSFPTPNFYETEIIGGLGGVRDNYSFNNPKILQFYKDELYVFDQGNYCIKVYDKDLGYVRNIRKSAFTKNNPPATVKLIDDKFYWLTTSGVFHILDNKLNPISQKQLYSFENSEVFIDFVVNESDNTMFVATKQNIYKYFFNNINYVGRFDLSKSNIRNIDINFMTLLDVEGVSKLFVYVRKNEFGAILVFSEANAYENLLSNYNFDVYSVDEIKVEKNEFVSNFSYNKSIIKLLGNNLQLKNFITNVVTVSLLRDGGINYDGISYFTEDDLAVLDYEPTLDNYIGTNEIFSRSVANRVLEKIYDYQLLLVSLFENKVTPPPSQVNILSPTLDALMLEDFPGNANGYYRLETGTAIQASLEENPDLSAVFHGHDVTGVDVNPLENLVDNRDIILLENKVLEQVPIMPPGLNDCAVPPTIVEEIVECDCFVTPFTTDCMFSEEVCLPPYDLIDLDGMYTETIVTETNLCEPGWFEPIYETEGDTGGERTGGGETQYIIGWKRISQIQLASSRFNHDSVREVTINDRLYKIQLETVSGGVLANYIRNSDDGLVDQALLDLNITPYGWGQFKTYEEGSTVGPDLGSMALGTTWVKEAIYFNKEQVELAGKCEEDNSDGNEFEVSVQTPGGAPAALGVSSFTWTNPNKQGNTVQRNSRDIIHKLDISKQFGVLAYLSLNEDAVNYFGNVTSIGRKSFETLNYNNQHRVDDTIFMMWRVPVPERFIGSWDYVGIDVTHFYYNVNKNCISAEQKDFFVYFDFFTVPGANNITPPQLTKEQLLDQFMDPELTVNNTYELIYSNLNASNEKIEVSSDRKQIKLYDSGSDSLDTTFTINSGDATFSADGNFITGNSSVSIELEWDDSPSTNGKAVDSITINGITWTQSEAKTGKDEKNVVLQAGYSVEGNVYDVNGCILYGLVKPNIEITKQIAEPEPETKPGTDKPVVNKGQSGGIIKPGVIIDPQDLKDMQEQLEHDPDFDLSVIGVQNADGDGFINPFTGQSASQGNGSEKNVKDEKKKVTP